MVTHRRAAIRVGGRHERVVFNPAGRLFRIGCFSDAPGLCEHGPPCAAFSWFDGYAWRVGLCGACGRHLGWAFINSGTAEPSRFYALVLDALIDGQADTGATGQG